MTSSPLDRLPLRQKQILRLVYEKYEAKQIAQALGISPHTVNDHMRAARRTLGVARTMDAARLLAVSEAPNRLGTDAIGIEKRAVILDETGTAPTDETVAARKYRYRLSPLARFGIIVALAFGVAAGTGATIEAADVITNLILSRHIDISDHSHQK